MNRFQNCKSVEEVIFQTIGAGSMCWENPRGAGIFQSEEAEKIGNEAIDQLKKIGVLNV